MNKIEYSQEFIEKAQKAKERGLNIYALIARYLKISKTAELIPESVYIEVLDQYLSEKYKVRNIWPYFITVLRTKSEAHFSKRNEEEGKRLKNEPANVGLIMRLMGGK